MPTEKQIAVMEKALEEYKQRFLTKKHLDLDEASTRLMINNFLIDILGFAEFEEVKTEHRISGGYADYVIQFDRKTHLIVEVKSIQMNLKEKHLRQSMGYASNEGVDWVLLTNGSVFSLYRVIFGKPVSLKKVFEHDLIIEKDLAKVSEDFLLLTRKSFEKGDIERYWDRFEVVEPTGLSRLLYYKKIISALRRIMKKETDISFSEEEVLGATHDVITHPIESTKPDRAIDYEEKPKKRGGKKSTKPDKAIDHEEKSKGREGSS